MSFLVSDVLIERIGWVLLHSLWQFTLLALFAAVVMPMMRLRSATARYSVLVAVLGVSVLAPVVTWLALPVEQFRGISDLNVGDNAIIAAEVESPTADERAQASETASASVAIKPAHTVSAPDFAPQTSATPRIANPPVSVWQRATDSVRPWLNWLVVGWSIGVVLCSGRPLVGWSTLRRLRTTGVSPVSDETVAVMQRIAMRLGLYRTVSVLQSALAQSPVVIGYLRPLILLPVGLLTSLPPSQLEAILAHELAHVRRHDFVVNVLQAVIETLFFYHPAVWWLSHRIRIEREHCCDDLVVSVLDNRAEYGRALLAIEEHPGWNGVLTVGAADGSLLARIRRIVGVQSHQRSPLWTERWPAAILALVVISTGCLLTLNWNLEARDVPNDEQPAQPAQANRQTTQANQQDADSAPRGDADAKTGRIKGTVLVLGPIPSVPPIPVASLYRSQLEAPEPPAENRVNESFLVSKEGGLANAFVYLKTAPRGFKPGPAPTEPVVLTNERLRIAPHVGLIRTGQSLVLKNADSEAQNFHSWGNNPFNVVVGAKSDVVLKDQHKTAEKLPYSISSDIQPWKLPVHLLCLDHPFAAITDSAGQFEIPDLPPGEHEFTVWHARVGYLQKNYLKVEVKAGETTDVPKVQVEVARFEVGKRREDARIEQWVDSRKGWSAGIRWASGTTEFTWNRPGQNVEVSFALFVRNDTNQPLEVTVPESMNWDFGMESQRRLNVRIHDRGTMNLALAANETRVLEVPSPKLNLDGIEPGFWNVSFSTPFSTEYLFLHLWLDAPTPRWVEDTRGLIGRRDERYKNVRWGESLQGLKFGVEVKGDFPEDSVQPDGEIAVNWSKTPAVVLKPEYYLWNTTGAPIEISMLNHTALDWVHRISDDRGSEKGPHPILTGPKFEEKRTLKAGEILRMGDSTLSIVAADSKEPAEGQVARLKPGRYGYWSFLNLHRTDLPHISLHLKSLPQRLRFDATNP